MKFELVMLTTVISVITERQVEAQLTCYQYKKLWGGQAQISDTNNDIRSKFSGSGAKACVVKKSSWIFYEGTNFNGKNETVHSGSDGYLYYPSSITIIRSIKKLTNSGFSCTGNTYQVGNKCEKCNCHARGRRWYYVFGKGSYKTTGCDPSGKCPCARSYKGKKCDIRKSGDTRCFLCDNSNPATNCTNAPGNHKYCHACSLTQVEGAANPIKRECLKGNVKIKCQARSINGKPGYTCTCGWDGCSGPYKRVFEKADYRSKYPVTD